MVKIRGDFPGGKKINAGYKTQFVIRDRAKILYIEFLRSFVCKFVGPKRTKITFFYDTTELVWLNYSLLR